jgi:hypothetical protein
LRATQGTLDLGLTENAPWPFCQYVNMVGDAAGALDRPSMFDALATQAAVDFSADCAVVSERSAMFGRGRGVESVAY